MRTTDRQVGYEECFNYVIAALNRMSAAKLSQRQRVAAETLRFAIRNLNELWRNGRSGLGRGPAIVEQCSQCARHESAALDAFGEAEHWKAKALLAEETVAALLKVKRIDRELMNAMKSRILELSEALDNDIEGSTFDLDALGVRLKSKVFGPNPAHRERTPASPGHAAECSEDGDKG